MEKSELTTIIEKAIEVTQEGGSKSRSRVVELLKSATEALNTEEPLELPEPNLAWGSLTAVSIEAAKHWLKFVLDVWQKASPNLSELFDEFAKARTVVDAITGTTFDPKDTELHELHEALSGLVSKILEADHQMYIWCKLDDGKLRIGWDGQWTAGRYVEVSYEPRNFPIVFVEWDTGTGAESNFLKLPSTAQQYAARDPKSTIRPLINVERLALKALGGDEQIAVTGVEGLNRARYALYDRVDEAVRLAEARAISAGFATVR